MNSHKGRVAFVATVYRHLEAFHIPFIQLLKTNNYEVHAFASFDSGKQALEELGVICHDIPFERSPFKISNLNCLKELIKYFKQFKFELIHFHTPVASIIGRAAAKITKVPHVLYTAHGFHFFKGSPLMYWILYYPIERFMARWTDTLITINREDYKRAESFPVKKYISYVPGVGVDTEIFKLEISDHSQNSKRKELNIGLDDIVVLCVAELNGNKNQTQLIDTIKILSVEFPNLKCLLVGYGEKESFYKEMVKTLKLEKHIHFLGFRRDISQLMKASDIVTLLSKREGLPKALLEALAAGKPIVTTDVRGNRDLVDNQVNGYVVPVANTDATVEAFRELILNPKKRTDFGNMSVQMSNQYDISTILNVMKDIYGKHIEILNLKENNLK